MEYGVIGLNYSVPVFNQCLVHLVYVLEWTVAESDDIGMVEMRIGREERVLGVEIVVHVIVLSFLQRWDAVFISPNLCKVCRDLVG